MKTNRNMSRRLCALDIRHAVITSVTRDDLPDGGEHSRVIERTEETPDAQSRY